MKTRGIKAVFRPGSTRRFVILGLALVVIALFSWYGIQSKRNSSAATAFTTNHDTTRGRIKVENDVLRLEFGYKSESVTHGNQGGGNLYYYYDKRFAPNTNIIATWEGGSSQTKSFASGVGGIGSLQTYAAPAGSSVSGYKYALSDNARDGTTTVRSMTTLSDGSLQIIFDVSVSNKDWTPQYEWFTAVKTWRIYPGGKISVKEDWTVKKTGIWSEPGSRNQVSTQFKQIGRWGHTWADNIAKPPGSNSRINPANKWYQWTPNPTSVQECNAPDGSGGSQDAVHADYNRFYGGASYDFWIWPDNGGLGFEGLGLYKVGYEAFGNKSSGVTANEICHHNRNSIGDGLDAYNLGPFAWWGGDGATTDRYKTLNAGLTWSDSFLMEARATSSAFPPDAPTDPNPPSDTVSPTATVSATPTTVTVGGTVNLSATANDNVAVTKVEFYSQGVLLGTDTTSPYTYAWNTTGQSSGTKQVTARAYDAAGNTGTSSGVNIIMNGAGDTTQPTVSLGATPLTANVGATVSLTSTASDNVAVTKVEFYNGSTLLGTDTSSPYSYSWNTTGQTFGTKLVTARAYDAAGNTGTSNSVNIVLSSPTGDGDVNNDGRVNALDLSALLSHDGQNYAAADFNNDGTVGAADMAILLSRWTW